VDCTRGLLRLHANSKEFSMSALYFYLEDERLATPRAMRLKGDEGRSMVEVANLLARHFGLEEAVMITDSPLTVRNLSEVFVTLNVGKSVGRTEVKHLVSRSVRSSGIKALFVIASSATADLILTALAELQMDEGYAVFLLGNDCQFTFTLYPTGVICVALAGSETAKTPEEANYWYLLYGLGGKALDKFTVNDLIQGNLVTIGLIDQGTLIISPIVVFPRGLLTPPDTLPIKVKVNRINMNSEDPAVTFRGSDFVLAKLPLSNRKFSIEPISLDDCSRIDPNTSFLPCYIASKTFKSTMLLHSSPDIVKLITALEFMRSTKLFLPVLDQESFLDMLSSSALYPNFTRLGQTLTYLFIESLLYTKYLKFDRIQFFASTAYGPTFADFISASFREVNIEVVTPREFQELDYFNPDPNFFEKTAELIVASKIRPCHLILASTSDYVKFFEALDEAAVDPKNVVLLISFQVAVLLESHPDKADLILKYTPACLTQNMASFVGDFGQTLKKQFLETFNVNDYKDCYNYDLTKQAVLAIEFALRRGLDMYDWKEMESAVRGVRFEGCSGMVTQSAEHNNRKDVMLDFLHYQENDEGVLQDVKVMSIALTGAQNYYQGAPVAWAGGATETPKVDWYTYKDCPFPEEYKQDSPKSSKRSAGIYFGFCGYAVAVALAAYFLHYRRVQMPELEEPILLGTQDLLIMLSSILEIIFIQIVSPGTLINFVLVGAISQRSLDKIDFSDGVYFQFTFLFYAIVGLWLLSTLLCVAAKFRPYSFDIQLFSSVLERAFSFIIFFFLLTLFDCNKAAARSFDEDIGDSYMDLDCNEYCWTDKHLKYSVASSLVLALYLLVSIPSSYYLSNTLDGHQFKTSQIYALCRQPFLLAFISLHKSKPMLSDIEYSVAFLIVLGAYIALCLRGQVFNVQTLTHWHNTLLGAVLIISTISTLNDLAYRQILLWMPLMFGLMIVLGVFALIRAKKLPKMILHPPKINISMLLNFAFRFNQKFRRSELYRQREEHEEVKEDSQNEEARVLHY
jgi:hypothetical protein